MSGKKIEEILGISQIDSMISKEWSRSIPGVENAYSIFENLKKDRYENLHDLEKSLSIALTSKKRILTDKLSENMLHFEFFSPLINQIHSKKKKDGRFYNWVGSLSRTVGSTLRGDSSQPQEFKNLSEAMKLFEEVYEVDENGIYKVSLGNVLRGLGETISGERATFLRVIRRTVGGINPFLKSSEEQGKDVKEELGHLICVSHALLRLFHHHENPVAATKYIEYLYSSIFPRFGLFNTSIILETGITNEGISTKKEDEDPSVYDTSFYRGIGRFVFFDKIWSNRRKYKTEEEDDDDDSLFVEEEEDEGEEEKKVGKIDEDVFVKECFDVLKKYESFFTFRHFNEVEEVSGVELEKKSKMELRKIFSAVYLRSYASMDSRSNL